MTRESADGVTSVQPALSSETDMSCRPSRASKATGASPAVGVGDAPGEADGEADAAARRRRLKALDTAPARHAPRVTTARLVPCRASRVTLLHSSFIFSPIPELPS